MRIFAAAMLTSLLFGCTTVSSDPAMTPAPGDLTAAKAAALKLESSSIPPKASLMPLKTTSRSTDWCSKEPLSATAKLLFADQKLDPQHGTGGRYWEEADLPVRVWCFVRDDQNPPRTQQCVGLGSDNCLQGWVDRYVGNFKGLNWLIFDNQHSRDTRYLTLYSE